MNFRFVLMVMLSVFFLHSQALYCAEQIPYQSSISKKNNEGANQRELISQTAYATMFQNSEHPRKADGCFLTDDPFEDWNRIIFAVNMQLDYLIIMPFVGLYRAIIPHGIRQHVHYFSTNAQRPLAIVNQLITLQPGKALKTLHRFFFNTVFGMGGMIDFWHGRPQDQPQTHVDVVKSAHISTGPYIVIPVLGSMFYRDFIATCIDNIMNPISIVAHLHGKHDRIASLQNVLYYLDYYSNSYHTWKNIKQTSHDLYAYVRGIHRQQNSIISQNYQDYSGPHPRNKHRQGE